MGANDVDDDDGRVGVVVTPYFFFALKGVVYPPCPLWFGFI